MLLAVFVNQFQDSGGPKIAIFDKISIHPWTFCLVPLRPHRDLSSHEIARLNGVERASAGEK